MVSKKAQQAGQRKELFHGGAAQKLLAVQCLYVLGRDTLSQQFFPKTLTVGQFHLWIQTGHPAGSAPDVDFCLKAQARSINLGGVLGFGTALEDIYLYSGHQLYEYSSPQIILLLASLSIHIHA